MSFKDYRFNLMNCIVSIVTICLASAAVVGVFIFFEELPTSSRFKYGLSAMITCLAIEISVSRFRILNIPSVLLAWYFLVFTFIYGNAVDTQMQYIDYRSSMVMSDICKLQLDNDADYSYVFQGSTGYAPVLRKQMSKYPVLKKLGIMTISSDFWGGYYFYSHYGADNLRYNPYNLPEKSEGKLVTSNFLHDIFLLDDNTLIIDLKKQTNKTNSELIHDPITTVN